MLFHDGLENQINQCLYLYLRTVSEMATNIETNIITTSLCTKMCKQYVRQHI